MTEWDFTTNTLFYDDKEVSMLQHIQLYWIDYFFGLIVALLALGYKKIWKRVSNIKKENKGIKNGMKALLHNEIMSMGKGLVSEGKCTPEQFEELEYLYKPYHEDLGGNGSAERMYNQVKELPQE